MGLPDPQATTDRTDPNNLYCVEPDLRVNGTGGKTRQRHNFAYAQTLLKGMPATNGYRYTSTATVVSSPSTQGPLTTVESTPTGGTNWRPDTPGQPVGFSRTIRFTLRAPVVGVQNLRRICLPESRILNHRSADCGSYAVMTV
ncbi:unnamed protein product [Calypogeia fissa]